jgi:hypothetical protein
MGKLALKALGRYRDDRIRRDGDLTDIKKGTVWRCRGRLIRDALCLTKLDASCR